MELEYIKNDPKPEGEIVCPYNPEIDCSTMRCKRCGWNPSVANSRTVNIVRKLEETYGRG